MTETPTPTRRRFQFGLRTMFVVVTAVAILFAFPTWAIAITALVGVELGLIITTRALFRSGARLGQDGRKYESMAVRLFGIAPMIVALFVYVAAMALIFSSVD